MHPRADVVCLICNVRFYRHLIGAGSLHSSLGPALLSSALRDRLHRTFLQGRGLPILAVLGEPGFGQTQFSENSEALGRRKGRDIITSALSCTSLGARGPLTARGCPLTGGGENLATMDKLPFASPPSSRTDRGILTQQSANCCKTERRGVSLGAAPSRVPSATPGPCG